MAAVRAFNRYYTRTLRLLDEGMLESPFSLTEIRVLYEVGREEGVGLTGLRDRLDLDAGYLSRVLARLADAGAVRRERSTGDRRRQVVRLTGHGRELRATFDRRANEQVGGLVGDLEVADRRRLVGAMGTVQRLLGPLPADASGRSPAVVLRPTGSGDHGWIASRHGALYAREHGWDESFEGLVARIVADLVEARRRSPDRVAGWIAEVDGERAGCVCCVEEHRDESTTEGAAGAATARLRLLLVEPWARGLGIGSQLVEECIRFARRAGYRRLVLWTNDVLVAARRIYERAGFTLVTEERHRSFGHDLVGQTWELDLVRPDPE